MKHIYHKGAWCEFCEQMTLSSREWEALCAKCSNLRMPKQEKSMTDKTLNNINMLNLEKNVPDVEIHGDPGLWKCICKASSKKEGWMKSTKAMQMADGVLVQVSTQQGDHVAEALEFVPNASIQERDGKFTIY